MGVNGLIRTSFQPVELDSAIADYRQLAADLGLDFDALVERGTPFEIARLRAMEA